MIWGKRLAHIILEHGVLSAGIGIGVEIRGAPRQGNQEDFLKEVLPELRF